MELEHRIVLCTKEQDVFYFGTTLRKRDKGSPDRVVLEEEGQCVCFFGVSTTRLLVIAGNEN